MNGQLVCFLRKSAISMTMLALFAVGCATVKEDAKMNAKQNWATMDRSKFNIGTYILNENAKTEKHIKEIAECGLDFFVGVPYETQTLDYFHKYGVGVFVRGTMPTWWGGDGKNAGTMYKCNPLSVYVESGKKFKDHPALFGLEIGDEPSALDFPHFGKAFTCIKESFPSRLLPFLNLYPNYASVADNTDAQKVNQLGTPTYKEHIDVYCKYFPADYICYDYYPYAAGYPGHYENLRIVANACRSTGRSLWIVLQVNSHTKERFISENQLRMQAYSALAFGAEAIIWSCYTQGWWENNVLDENGNKTEQYAKLQKVNAELHSVTKEYMRYRNTSTHFVGFKADSPYLAKLQDTPALESLSTGIFFDVKPEEGGLLIVGQMASRERDGSSALFLCAADDPEDKAPKQFNVTFRCNGKSVTANGVALSPNADGLYSLPMKSCSGVLLVSKP